MQIDLGFPGCITIDSSESDLVSARLPVFTLIEDAIFGAPAGKPYLYKKAFQLKFPIPIEYEWVVFVFNRNLKPVLMTYEINVTSTVILDISGFTASPT